MKKFAIALLLFTATGVSICSEFNKLLTKDQRNRVLDVDSDAQDEIWECNDKLARARMNNNQALQKSIENMMEIATKRKNNAEKILFDNKEYTDEEIRKMLQ